MSIAPYETARYLDPGPIANKLGSAFADQEDLPGRETEMRPTAHDLASIALSLHGETNLPIAFFLVRGNAIHDEAIAILEEQGLYRPLGVIAVGSI
jgi:hypothetical protein